MRRLAYLAPLLCAMPAQADPPPQPLPTVLAGAFHIVVSQTRLYSDNVVDWQAHIAGIPDHQFGNMDKNVWYHVDLDRFGVKPIAAAVFLACDGIITGYPGTEDGPAPIVPETTITFRRPDNVGALLASETIFMGQLISPLRGDGTRSNASWIVPVAVDGSGHASLDYSAWFPDGPRWDGTMQGGAAYQWNCSMQGWWESAASIM